MEATSKTEHDLWMDKINRALRSFLTAGERKATQAQTPRHHSQNHELDGDAR